MRWLALLFFFLTTSCDEIFEERVCTAAGCYSSFELSFNAENDSHSLGDYSVLVGQESGQQLVCSFTLVETGSNCSSIDCIDNRSCDIFQMEASPFGHDVYYSSGEEKVFMVFSPLEGELQVTIIQDGDSLFGLKTELVYEINQPNGPSCEPTCFNARTEITLNRN